jgi:hypothetical protein
MTDRISHLTKCLKISVILQNDWFNTLTVTYIHCAAHNLILVLNDAVSGVSEAASFFVILQDL